MAPTKYATLGGVLLLVSMAAGFFGEMYVPGKIVVPTDAAKTAANIKQLEWLFRLGFATYLLEALADVTLAWIFFVLLRKVHKEVALLSVFFGLVSTALFGCAQLIYFSSSLVLRDASYLTSFSPEQRHTIALLAVKTYGLGAGLFMCFYGVASILRAILIFRSTYLPRFLAVLLGAAGVGFVAKNALLVLAPAYSSNLLLLPMFVAVVSMALWLLTKGIDVEKWEQFPASPR